MSIRLFLRDKNKDLVNAWQVAFEGYQHIDISWGNIFDIKADAIISPANSFGFMDGGIDFVYSEYFGWEVEESLQSKIRSDYNGELPIGLAAIIETKNANIKYLISCPTMRVPEGISNTVNAYLAFRAGLIEVINFNKKNDTKITSILCPGLGTLTGRMTAINCAKQMKYAYDTVILNKHEFPDSLWSALDTHNELKGK